MRSFFIGVLILLGASAIAQDLEDFFDYGKPREYEIADIQVTGVEFLQPRLLVNISGLKSGGKITIPGDDITNVVEKFWSQKLFSDVRISASKIEGNKVWIEIYLKEKPRLSTVQIEGVRKSDKEDIAEKINIRRGSDLSPNVLNNIQHIITNYYKEKGFLNTAVEFTQIADTAYDNRVILKVDINKNNKVKIKEIEFVGNNVFDNKRLRRVLKKTKQIDLNIFKGSKLIAEDYKEDKKKLRDFYSENGYRDFKLISDSIFNLSDDRIKLVLNIYEGNQYYFGDIQWVGNTKYETELLKKVLGISKGDVYDQTLLTSRLSTDEDAVTSLYMDDGYLFFSVDPVEKSVQSDTINLQMQIYEGQQARYNSIIIKGNTKTNEHVIRRELRTLPGDLFSKTKLIRSVRELAALGHFNPETINPVPIPNQTDGTVDLEIELEERSNDQLELSAGYGGYGPVGTIGLRFSNFAAGSFFDKSAWSPLPTGDGQTLSIRAQLNGTGYQSYNLSFVEPWFGGKKPNSFSFSIFGNIYDQGKQRSRYYERRYGQSIDTEGSPIFKALGASVGIGQRLKRPDDFFTLYNEITAQQYNLKNYYSIPIPGGSGNILNLSYKITLSRNSMDQMIYPRKGSSFSLSAQLTPPYSMIKGKEYWKLTGDERVSYLEQARGDIKTQTPGIGTLALEKQALNSLKERELQDKYKLLEYHKWTFKSAWYTTLFDDVVLSARAEYGHLGMYNSSVGYSPFEKFDVGGSGLSGYNITGTDIVALRGYDDGGLTPTEAVGDRIYDAGNIYTKYTAELRYLISPNPSATIYALAFAEAGNAWSNFESFNPFVVKRSVGVGLRAFLPMFGMLGIDFGYGFDDPVRGESRKFMPHFILGQQF